MTSLASFGSFIILAVGSVFGFYRFYLSQRKQRDEEIEERAREKFTMAELQRELAELRKQRDQGRS